LFLLQAGASDSWMSKVQKFVKSETVNNLQSSNEINFVIIVLWDNI
jgi:hypothetical protein